MSTLLRLGFLTLLLVSAVALIGGLYWKGVATPLRSSLAPAFQLLGHSTKALDSLITRVIPVDALDEAALGQVMAAGYEHTAVKTDPDFIYLNDLVQHQAPFLKKPFAYRIYLIDRIEPNAMALPGGVILVTNGLLGMMKSEAELMAVLSHELGHIELNHCLDTVKFELLTRRITHASYGKIADLAAALLTRHSFSKTVEDQADEYAYALMIESTYDPRGVAGAFTSLLQYQNKPMGSRDARADLLRDYFLSHPPTILRREKFKERADAWWRMHPTERRFVGTTNLQTRTSFYTGVQSNAEWIVFNTPAPAS
jgi:beta-barrel assembly-enhancing protease